MVVGLLRIEVHLPNAQSLKDKRSVITSLKAQMRRRFNVSVVELDAKFFGSFRQRATFGVSTLGDHRTYVEGLLRQVTEWVQMTRLVNLIRIEEEYL